LASTIHAIDKKKCITNPFTPSKTYYVDIMSHLFKFTFSIFNIPFSILMHCLSKLHLLHEEVTSDEYRHQLPGSSLKHGVNKIDLDHPTNR
jgi:hypothetical protein